jgi:hypothetical protein
MVESPLHLRQLDGDRKQLAQVSQCRQAPAVVNTDRCARPTPVVSQHCSSALPFFACKIPLLVLGTGARRNTEVSPLRSISVYIYIYIYIYKYIYVNFCFVCVCPKYMTKIDGHKTTCKGHGWGMGVMRKQGLAWASIGGSPTTLHPTPHPFWGGTTISSNIAIRDYEHQDVQVGP